MELVNQVLKTHSGRDLCLRTASYAFRLMSAVPNRKMSIKFLIIAKQMSECRVILRLYDDLVMLRYSLNYGLGKKECDVVLRWLGVLSNVVNQLYYPVEHIAWAADKRLINIDSTIWWNSSTMLWAISLYLGIVRACRFLYICKKSTFEDSESTMGTFEKLSIIQNICDLCNAIHWLPEKYLWSQKLKPWQVGLFGMISSAISFYKYLISMQIK